MSSVPNCGGANNGLTLRARAHSTSASTERYAYGRPSNLQSNQQQQHHQHQHQQQHHQQIHSRQFYQRHNTQAHGNQLARIGQSQANANSMLTLNSLNQQQTANEAAPIQSGMIDSTPLHLQLTPRLLASDSAGYFVEQQHQHRDLSERVCQSARPSTVHLVEATRDELPVVGSRQVTNEHTNRTKCPVPTNEISNCSPEHRRHSSRTGEVGHQPEIRPDTGLSFGTGCESTRRTSTTSKRYRSSTRTSDSRRPTSAQDTDRTITTTGACGENLSIQALSLLRKNAFNCTILGARQTGKRSIVICFVKLLNEFKLAADEYKRETMITKLVECSEKLQELASRREQLEGEEEEEQHRRQQRRTSRLNSWLPSGETVKNLLNLSPVSKKRLHSVAGPLLNVGLRKQSDVKQHGGGSGLQVRSDESQRDQRHQRRHTAIEPPSFQRSGNNGSNHERDFRLVTNQEPSDGETTRTHPKTTTTRFLNVNRGHQRSNLLSVHHNKSDTDISYQTIGVDGKDESECVNISASEPTRPPSSSYQLQVPSWEDSVNFRKQSEPMNVVGDTDDTRDAPATTMMPRQERRHTTNVSSVGFLRSEPDQECSSKSRPRCSISPSTGATISARQRPRRQSICMSRRRRRILLSLKELNRRKFAIKFNTRRQISASLIEQMREADQMRASNRGRAGRRRSTIIQLSGGVSGGSSAGFAPLPDAFLVVYSINDRDSFDYARSMIEQLRSISALLQQDVPLPIMLVANKSDLERNREVKIEDGRAVAKKYSCKFIEISCTIGFNLDNLLVGLRTQLVLKHHIVLNSILRPGTTATTSIDFRRPATKKTTDDNNKYSEGIKTSKDDSGATKDSSDNILVRFYKRYVMDNHENEYDCDNFSKL